MPLKKSYQAFVNEMILSGWDQVKSYMKAYPKSSEASARAESYRLLKIPEISEALREAKERINQEALEEAKEELKEEIKVTVLSAHRKREILSKIALGELEVPVKKPVWDKDQKKYVYVTVHEIPDHMARMKAIEIDNRMAGDWSPEEWKGDLTNKGRVVAEIDYSQLTEDQIDGLMRAAIVKDIGKNQA